VRPTAPRHPREDHSDDGAGARLGKRARRRRLDHVDAMRPIKQLGMLSTHSLLLFAPAASLAGGAAGASLLVTHVSRFTFMFISAAMLVYAYPQLTPGSLRTFWRRRLLAVGLPYLTWTLVYFLLAGSHVPHVPPELSAGPGLVVNPARSAQNFLYLLGTGYFQLYYLLLLLELYLAYPALLWLLRRTAGHHVWLVIASFGAELVLTSLIHWAVLPSWLRGGGANKELWNYQLYLVAGGVLAWHYEQCHAWLRQHWRVVLATTAATALTVEAWYFAALYLWPGLAGALATEPFQPIVVPFYLALTASVYLLAVDLTDRRRSARTRTTIRRAADNSYGIYLCHAVFLIALTLIGWASLDAVLPWPVVVIAAVALVYVASTALTRALARLPGRRATVGETTKPAGTGLVDAAGLGLGDR
jgi:peptidoglycan/LPS O-acetylase OafA/YrhL